jgi:hypothetical protein
LRRALGSCAAVIAAAGLLSACNAAVDKAVGEGKGEITVSHTDEAIVIENGSGRPALNVRVTLDGGSAGTFFIVVPTMDTGEKKTVLFGLLRSEDGTLLDTAAVSPRDIKLTARDTLNNSYEATVPWD